MPSSRSLLTELAIASRSLIRIRTERRVFWLLLVMLGIQGMSIAGTVYLRTRVDALSVAMESYSDRFYARDRQRAVVLTPRALVFKIKGYPSFRLAIRKRGNRIELYVRDPQMFAPRTSRLAPGRTRR